VLRSHAELRYIASTGLRRASYTLTKCLRLTELSSYCIEVMLWFLWGRRQNIQAAFVAMSAVHIRPLGCNADSDMKQLHSVVRWMRPGAAQTCGAEPVVLGNVASRVTAQSCSQNTSDNITPCHQTMQALPYPQFGVPVNRGLDDSPVPYTRGGADEHGPGGLSLPSPANQNNEGNSSTVSASNEIISQWSRYGIDFNALERLAQRAERLPFHAISIARRDKQQQFASAAASDGKTLLHVGVVSRLDNINLSHPLQ
jgi:hypothetical protein